MHHIMHRPRGFTLLEIMVVMVIVAVLAAIVTPNLFAGKSRGKDLEREAAMLTARLRVAQDDAMFYGNEYGLVFSEDGYRFVRWNAELARFVAPPAVDAWTQRDFEDEIRVSAAADDGDPILVLPEPKEKDEAESVTPALDAAAGDEPAAEEPYWQPSVFVLSSGEVTPFTAVFSAEGVADVVELNIDPLGNRRYAPGAEPATPGDIDSGASPGAGA